MEEAISKSDLTIITSNFNEEALKVFNKYNDKMDLLLGSYYRTNDNKALHDEDERVEKAKKELDECLKIMSTDLKKQK